MHAHGEEQSIRRMFELTYDDLRRIARRQRLVGRSTDRIQAAALVHETYIRFLRRLHGVSGQVRASRHEFVKVITLMMRSVAIDRWRMRRAGRRGGNRLQPLRSHEVAAAGNRCTDVSLLLTLEDALDGLRRAHPECFEVVVQRYFAGRTLRETAATLGIDVLEVRARRRRAFQWLRRALAP